MPENYLDQRTIAKWRKDTEQYEPLSPTELINRYEEA